ncbi:MAG: hypothetical protein Fur0022_35660 [Anaerolineales bacterium]
MLLGIHRFSRTDISTTTQLYKPLPCTQGRLWGEVCYQSGTLPTAYILPCTQDRLYTGQYSHTADPSTGSGQAFGLMYYVARWYDPYLNRFIQPDSIVPNLFNPGDLDRYTYSANNPIRYNDPSGHHYCDSQYAAEEACDWYNKAPLPDEVCLRDIHCEEAYKTYNELIFILGRIPSPEEILYMTAQAEGYGAKGEDYHGSGTFEVNFIEGLARSYWEPYEACESGSSTCSTSKLYKFLSGYQPWWDSSKSPAERADYLLEYMNRDSYRKDLESQVDRILDEEYAGSQGWTHGMVGNQPWQWHNWWWKPTSGEALGWIYFPGAYGDYFWIMTADQTAYFQACIKNQCAK